jgi:SAM-dependent methyltransferase
MKSAIFFILNRFPKLRFALRSAYKFFTPDDGVSSHYVSLRNMEIDKEARRLRNSWQDDSLPQRQRLLVEQQLSLYRSGDHIDVFDVFVDSLRVLPNMPPDATLLEVGCSSGFYSEVVEIAKLPIKYSGCDYSEAFISLAKKSYPFVDFEVADATFLRYGDSSFDIVVSGGCLLHIPEYAKGIEETARVARRYAIFHRTPVVWGQPTKWYRKKAYGIETVEIHFNEEEFLVLLAQNGLELIHVHTLSEDGVRGTHEMGNADRTYVCRKKY